MSKIENILTISNFELIRSRIAAILADELSEQLSLNEAALKEELLKPIPDPVLVKFYQLNISCIPSKVYEDRFHRFQPSEYPAINVVFVSNPLDDGTSDSVQHGENKYQIEFYQQSKTNTENRGDSIASHKLHRLIAICRSILMDRNYKYLELPDIVGYRIVQNIVIAQPIFGADSAQNAIMGKFDCNVKCPEIVDNLDTIPLNISFTDHKINDTEKGYYYEITT